VIALEKITKWFDDRRLFNDLSVDIVEGNVLCVVGPSGSGKSTLLRMIMGMEPPTQGRVLFMGKDIYRLKPGARAYLRRNIGMIFQDFRLVPFLTAWQNVGLPLKAVGMPISRINARTQKALDAVGLSQMSEKLPASLSGGEQQRVAVARVMAMEPVVVLADEPFGNLDKSSAALVMQQLLSLNKRGAAIIVATHDIEIAEQMNAGVVDLSKGVEG